jgi:FKBP-type peptidyl-prolyl cis-trans isomerase
MVIDRAQRSVMVTPDQGYGDKGFDEIPGGATFEMQIEVLSIAKM